MFAALNRDSNHRMIGLTWLLAGQKLHTIGDWGPIDVSIGGEESSICFDTRLQIYILIGQCCNLIGIKRCHMSKKELRLLPSSTDDY